MIHGFWDSDVQTEHSTVRKDKQKFKHTDGTFNCIDRHTEVQTHRRIILLKFVDTVIETILAKKKEHEYGLA